MASGLYAKYRENALTASSPNLSTADIRFILIDSADYTVNLTTHDFLDDVPGAARVKVSAALGTKTVAAGVFDAADQALATVTGDPCEAVVGYEHSGTDSTSDLIWYQDGISITPNGGTINVTFDNGANKIFAI